MPSIPFPDPALSLRSDAGAWSDQVVLAMLNLSVQLRQLIDGDPDQGPLGIPIQPSPGLTAVAQSILRHAQTLATLTATAAVR